MTVRPNRRPNEALPGFVLYVPLGGGLISSGDLRAEGQDLRVIDGSNGASLPYEVERIDDEGGSLWVRLPVLTATPNQTFWIYGGNPDASTQQDPDAVWAGYDGVWHLTDAEDAAGRLDLFVDDVTTEDGPVGGAGGFDGNASLELPDDSDVLRATTAGTIAGWLRLDTLNVGGSTWMASVARGGGASNSSRLALGVTADGNYQVVAMPDDTGDFTNVAMEMTAASVGEWVFVVGTIDYVSGRVRVYEGGELLQEQIVDVGGVPTSDTPSAQAALGAQDNGSAEELEGALDEIRIIPEEKSAEWVRAQFRAMTDDLLSLGAREAGPSGLAPGDPPSAANDNITLDEDSDVELDVLGNDSDPDGQRLSLDSVTAPSLGDLEIKDDGRLIYRPDNDVFGDDSFQYTMGDGANGFATATVSLSITPVNDRPFAATDTIAITEDVSGTFNVLANDSDDDDDVITLLRIDDAPALGTIEVLSSEGSVHYSPLPDVVGSDSFTYVISDGVLQDTGTVNLTISAVDDPLVPPPASVLTFADLGVTRVIELGGTDVDDTPTWTITNPPNGQLVAHDAPNGPRWLYTPAPLATSGAVDSFGYEVSSGGQSVSATVDIGLIDGFGTYANRTRVDVNVPPDPARPSTSGVVPVRLAPGVFDLDRSVDGTDLAVTAMGSGEILPFEVERYGADALLWVKLPEVIPSDAMYFWIYDSPIIGNTNDDVLATWSDFEVSLHLDGSVEDVTGSGRNGGSAPVGQGLLGNGALCTDGVLNLGADPALNDLEDVTLSFWMMPDDDIDSLLDDTQILVDRFIDGETNIAIMIVGEDYAPPSGSSPPDGALMLKVEHPAPGATYTWTDTLGWGAGTLHHIAVTVDADQPTNNRLYVDGVDATDGHNGHPGPLPFGNTADLRFCGLEADPSQLSVAAPFIGVLDELRLRPRLALPAEILLEAQADASLLTFQPSEVVP